MSQIEIRRMKLKQLQMLPLEQKIHRTKRLIQEFYDKFDGEIYISFSGGKDSTVLLNIAREIYPDIEAVFADTGLEYPEVRDFVNTYNNVTWVKPKMQFDQVVKKFGYPVISKEVATCVEEAQKGLKLNNGKYKYRTQRIKGLAKDKNGNKSIYNLEKYEFLLDAPFKISGKCCNEMKKKPLDIISKYPVIGTMVGESSLRMSSYLRHGCNNIDTKKPKSMPISFWNEQDVLLYLKINNIKIANIYGEITEKNGQMGLFEEITDLETTGVKRTGCMFCMFGVHLEKGENRFEKMKKTHPKIYDYCIREKNGLGIGKVLDFINVKY